MAQGPRGARRAALAQRAKIQQATAKEVLRLLDLARRRIAAQLAAQASDYERWRLPVLRQAIEREMAVFSAAAGKAVEQGAAQAWTAGRTLVDAPLEASGRVTVVATLPDLSTTQLSAISAFMVDRIADISSRTASRITQELGLVMIGQQSPSDAIGKLTRIFAGDRERAITIVRTEIGRVFAVAGQARLEQVAASVPTMKKQWRRSGKVHSRWNHDAIDGQVQDVDKPFELVTPKGETVLMMHPRDPAAPIGETINCGCESLPYMDEWEVASKGRKPFEKHELPASELKRNPVKAAFVKKQRAR